jgi:hypothetical protein
MSLKRADLALIAGPVMVGGGVASLLLMLLNRTYRPVSEVKKYVDEVATAVDGIATHLAVAPQLEGLERAAQTLRERSAMGTVRVLSPEGPA